MVSLCAGGAMAVFGQCAEIIDGIWLWLKPGTLYRNSWCRDVARAEKSAGPGNEARLLDYGHITHGQWMYSQEAIARLR